ncbi:MAG: tetratricopeptide repeat protein [Chthoniobacteraceae bacterium]
MFRLSSIVFSVTSIWALADTSVTSAAPSVDELRAKGAAFDQRFEASDALTFYLAAEKLDPKNATILTAIARQYRYQMADTADKGEKLRLGRIALSYSQRAAALAPNDAEAQLSVAITLGKMLPFLGSREQVDASPRIKKSVDAALRLDARNDVAWHILGRWHRVLADVSGLKRVLAGAIYGSLPKGSNEEAARALEKAVALNPNRLMHYIELGRVYAQMGRKDEARKFLNKGLSMPNLEKDDPETKARGREALEKLR